MVSRNERNILILSGIGHFATHLFELMFPTLAVGLAAETGVPLPEVLGWSFVGYLLFGLGALPAGLVADRMGAARLVRFGLVASALAALACAAARPGTELVLGLSLLGAAISLYHPAGMSLISRGVAARGRGLGLNGACGNAAVALTPALSAALAARFGWRGAYAIAGGAVFLVALGCMALPVVEPRVASGERAESAQARNAVGRGHLPFVLLCVASMLAGVSYRGNTVAQPAYFAARVGFLGYGTATSLVYLLGIAGQLAGGYLADRTSLRRLYLGFHAASLPALVVVAYSSGLTLLAAAGLFTLLAFGMQPVENTLFAQYTSPRRRAAGYGLKCILSFGVGSLAVQLIRARAVGGELGPVFTALALVVAALVAVAALFVAVTDDLPPAAPDVEQAVA